MDAETYDWTRFEIVEYYDRPIGEVFRAWATAAGLESFFLRKAGFTGPEGTVRLPGEVARKGDRYRWEWWHPFELEGEITGVVEDREVAFTFGSMRVSVLLSTVGDRTEVHLVQSGIEETAAGRVFGHLNCRSCWIFFLVNLKSVLATGVDLRDADPERVSSIEVGFVPHSARG